MTQYYIQSQNENSLISLLTDRQVPRMAECFDCHRYLSQHLRVREHAETMQLDYIVMRILHQAASI